MNILITSAGRRGYMVKYFQQALAGSGLVYAANSEWTSALQVADGAVITPHIYDTSYIDFLLEYCIKYNISAVLSLFDIDIPVLARFRKVFEDHGIKLLVSDYEVTQICNDKWKTYEFLKKNNILTPQTFISFNAVQEALDKKNIKFPLIIKPRWGMGSIGIYSASNDQELSIFFSKVKKEVLDSYLKFESSADIEHSVMFQEKLSGVEYGLDVVNDLEKKYITTFVKRKLSMRSGETDRALTEKNEILESVGSELSKHVGHIANLDVDCFLVDDKVHILEMNCRFGGHYPFSHLAGANIPLAIVHWLKGTVPPQHVFSIHSDVEGIKDIHPIILYRHEKTNQ